MTLTDTKRDAFDALVEEAIGELPERVRAMLDEVPLIILDEPTPAMLRDLGADPGEGGEIAGLHTGISRTERSVEHSGELPGQIHIFRAGVIHMAGGWPEIPDLGESGPGVVEILRSEAFDDLFDQIWITLLHEIGHEMGLDEDDLEELGYD